MRPAQAFRFDGILDHFHAIHRTGHQHIAAIRYGRQQGLIRFREQHASGDVGLQQGRNAVGNNVVFVDGNRTLFGGEMISEIGIDAQRVEDVQLNGVLGDQSVGVKNGIELDITAAQIQEP